MTEKPLVLASGSAIRQMLLKNAGIRFEPCPADVDEAGIAAAMLRSNKSPGEIAGALADEKALAVSQAAAGRTVLGADQVLTFGGQLMMKCADGEDARRRLKMLRGQTHALISAMALVRDGAILWRHEAVSHLTMRHFSDDFLEGYLARGLPDILSSVGAYFVEGEGLQLFREIKGDYFAILGLPLVPLTAALRAHNLAEA